MHAVGVREPFQTRRRLDAVTYGRAPLQRLLDGDLVPPAQRPAFEAAARRGAIARRRGIRQRRPLAPLRLHGDCHPGNILWRDEGPHIVDLDDCCSGPAVQDLWMLLSGDRRTRCARQLSHLLDGYAAFMHFDARELALIEPLRTLRMLHHSAWLAERWGDPAFPAAFPWFGSASYWSQQTHAAARAGRGDAGRAAGAVGAAQSRSAPDNKRVHALHVGRRVLELAAFGQPAPGRTGCAPDRRSGVVAFQPLDQRMLRVDFQDRLAPPARPGPPASAGAPGARSCRLPRRRCRPANRPGATSRARPWRGP